MSTPPITKPLHFFILIAIQGDDGGILGVHADASDEASAADIWLRVHDEIRLCQLFELDALPEPVGPGMLCICGEVTDLNRTGGSMVAEASPAPAWRRPTLDEMIAVIEGKTPPNIRAWLDAA